MSVIKFKNKPPITFSTVQRFFTRTIPGADGCILSAYAGGKTTSHRSMRITGKTYPVQNVAFWLSGREIPENHYVLHTCGVAACVKFDHLYAAPYEDFLAYREALRIFAPRKSTPAIFAKRARGSRNGNAKLDEYVVNAIRAVYSTTDTTQAELARRFGVSRTHIGNIVRGTDWKHI